MFGEIPLHLNNAEMEARCTSYYAGIHLHGENAHAFLHMDRATAHRLMSALGDLLDEMRKRSDLGVAS